MLTPTELVVYTIINHIHLKNERDDNLMKFVIPLAESLLKPIDGFL